MEEDRARGGTLRRPRRRRSHARQLARTGALLVAGAVLSFAVAAAVGMPEWERQDRLLREGTPVTATIVDGAWRHSRMPRSVHVGTLTFEYTLGERTYRASLTATDDSPEVRDGDTLTVFVDPAHPDQIAASRFDTAAPWRVVITLFGFVGTGFLLLIGLIALARVPFVAWRRSRRERRLREKLG